MKLRSFIAILFTVLYGLQVYSQATLGLRGGYTKAWPDYGDTVLPEDAETDVQGYNISIMVYTHLSSSFSIGVEPGLVQRGAACFPGWQPVFLGDTRINLSMLEFPVLFKKDFDIPTTKITIAGKLGYGVSYAISGKETITPLEPNPQPITSKFDLNDPALIIDRWDHGVYSGLECRYQINKKHSLIAETNFYMGMYNIDRVNYAKNRSLSLCLGYMYVL